jgi:DNA-directed RNA polymerase beta' subunit
MRKSFGDLIGDRGGDMEIPFPLTYPTGELTETVSAASWKLPVLSSHLRSGQEFDDGTSVTHDYTRSYQDVFVEACRYRYMAEQLEDHGLSPDKRAEVRRGMSESVSRAQRAFEAITTDVQNRVLTGKNNIFKTGLMSSRLSDSATMVWTADPRLDIDQIALSSVKAEQLGLAEGDHALVWRDPVLRDAGVRYMRVAIDDRLTGAAINPVMDQCFDGDFDGDAVAVVRLHSEAAKAEAMARLSVGSNLLDTGVVKADGSHPLAMQVSLDTQVALSKSPELAESLESAVREANRLRFVSDPHEVAAGHEVLVEELSDLYRSAQRGEFGSALTFSSREAHQQSVREVCVETGAKGSEKKLGDYARNLGDEQGTPGITQEDQEASMFATAIKAHGTGLGGSFSQRAVRALRGADLKAVLEVTYPVTQSILQAKHDAAEARHKYEMLQGPGRDLWRGRKLEHTGPGQWRPEFADGEAVQATAEEWEAQFVEFYEAKDGFNVSVNPDCVARVARALEDPKTGLVRNLEEDPSLAGTVMDRMAYGGDFETLVQAAKNRESVFDGEKNEQFASAGTRRARSAAARELDAFAAQGLDGLDSVEAAVDASVLKRDVLAQTEDGAARARGASRRSAHAVGVGGRRPAWTPSYKTGQQQSDDDYGLGG